MPRQEGKQQLFGGVVGKKEKNEGKEAEPAGGRHPGAGEVPVGPEADQNNRCESQEASHEK